MEGDMNHQTLKLQSIAVGHLWNPYIDHAEEQYKVS